MAKETGIWDFLTTPESWENMGENAYGLGEIGAAIGTDLLSLAPQGLNTLYSLPSHGVDATIKSNEKIADAMTYRPKSEQANNYLQTIAGNEAVQQVGSWDEQFRDWSGEKNAYDWMPEKMRAGMYAAGTVAPEIAGGLMGLRTLRGLLDAGDISTAYKPGMKNQAGAAAAGRRTQPRGQSKADAIAEGWKDDIGAGKNLKIHRDDMSYKMDGDSNLSPQIERTPDDLLGKTGIYTAGDRSRADGSLLEVNNEQLPLPVRTEGGSDYPRDMSHPYGWASSGSVMGNLEATVKGAQGRGTQPIGIFAPMKHKSMDFNTMMSDATLGLMQRDMSPTSKKAFDTEMRRMIKQAQGQKQPTLKGVKWKGIDDPESLAQLDTLGDLRHAFMLTTKKDNIQAMKGAPDLPSIRNALTKPELLDVPEGEIGQSMSLLEGGLVKNAPDGHSTYDTSMYGSNFGALNEPSSVEKMFPSFLAHRRLTGGDPTKDHRSLDMKKPWQMYDRETIAGMKGEPLRAVEGSSTGERVPFGGGGHLSKLNEQPYAVKQQYDDLLGDFNAYKAAGFDTDDTHKAIGAWSEDGVTQQNPVRVEKPVFENGLDADAMEAAQAVESYKGLTNIQAGNPYNVQTRAGQDTANALRMNFRKEPTAKEIDKLSLLAEDNGLFLSPSGHGRYSLLSGDGNPIGERGTGIAKQVVGSEDQKGLLGGGQSAIIEPVSSKGDYIDMSEALSKQNTGAATQQALDSWKNVMPMMERMLESPEQSAYISNKMLIDAKTAQETGDITRHDFARLYEILGDAAISGKEKIKKLKEGAASGSLPAAGFMTFDEDE